MRRPLAMLLSFQSDAGYVPPHSETAIWNYSDLLAAMGRSKAEIAAAITALRQDAGLGAA